MLVTAATTHAASAVHPSAPAAATAPPADPKRALDITRVPFKLMLEVKCGDAAMLGRKLSAAGWGASPQPADCSHNSEGCRYGGYSRIQSPQMTLADGGLEKIGTALDILRAAVGNEPGLTAAMRITVTDSVLDDKGVTNLVNMHLANEALIYRLGQAGGRGRTMADKQQYCPPLSTGNGYTAGRTMYLESADYHNTTPHMRSISGLKSVAQWRKDLASYHWGMNASNQGHWEFRYFDSSFDVKAVQNNVKLLLGMLKAAQEDRGTWDTVRPLPDTVNSEVSRRQWNGFIGTVAPDIKGDLEKAFIASGGKLERDVAIPSLSEMITAGWRFENGSAPLALEPLVERLRDGQGLEIRPPESKVSYPLSADQVSNLVAAERGTLDRLQQSELAALKDVQQIAQSGVSLHDGQGNRLGAALAWVLSAAAGQVQARRGDEVMPLDPSTVSLVKSADKAISAALSTALDALPGAGARLVDGDGKSVEWGARLGYLYKNAALFAVRGDDKILVDSPATVRDRVLRPHLESTLDAAQRARVDMAQTLEKGGYALHDQSGKRLEPKSLGWLEQVVASDARLNVEVPNSTKQFPLSASGLDNLSRQLSGKAIDADLQDAIVKAEALRSAGCSVPPAVDTLPALTAGEQIRWTDPLGHAHTATGTEAFRTAAGTQLDSIHMVEGQRQALDAVGSMMNGGQVYVRMPSQAFVTTMQQVPWLLSSQAGIEIRARAEEGVPVEARPAVVALKSWSDVERFVQVERDPSIAGASGALLGQMRAIGAQVYPVTATRKARKAAVPITLNSAALQSLDQGGLRFQLPSWTLWKGLPRRNVIVHGGDELARLAKKFT